MMRSMIAWIARNFGLVVWVTWDDMVYEHCCLTMKEALEWMKCYPKSASVQILDLRPWGTDDRFRFAVKSY